MPPLVAAVKISRRTTPVTVTVTVTTKSSAESFLEEEPGSLPSLARARATSATPVLWLQWTNQKTTVGRVHPVAGAVGETDSPGPEGERDLDLDLDPLGAQPERRQAAAVEGEITTPQWIADVAAASGATHLLTTTSGEEAEAATAAGAAEDDRLAVPVQ